MRLDHAKIKDRIMQIGLETGASHIASAMSCVDLLCDIYEGFPDGIVILSKGHGALAQYVILNEMGKLPDNVLKAYYKDGGLSCHSTLMPEYGIYASTGSLGHGLAIGIGYAIVNKKKGKQVIVVLSDGELDTGTTLESLKIINRLRLGGILVVVDWNDLTAFGDATDEDVMNFRFRPYYSIKGHGWGKLEGKVDSHYAIVDEQLMKEWKRNARGIERERVRRIKEMDKLIKKKNATTRS